MRQNQAKMGIEEYPKQEDKSKPSCEKEVVVLGKLDTHRHTHTQTHTPKQDRGQRVCSRLNKGGALGTGLPDATGPKGLGKHAL